MEQVGDPPELLAWADQHLGAATTRFRRILAGDHGRRGLTALADAVYQALATADSELAARLPRSRRFACRRGCCACCHAFIQSAPLYTIAAFEYAARNGPPDQAARQWARAERRRRPCPFLEDGACQIYPVRPPVCRYYFSFNHDLCQIDRCCVIDSNARFDRQWHAWVVRVSFAIERAAADALAGVGLGSEPHALDAGIRILLASPDGVERWVAGEPVFAGAAMPAGGFDWRGLIGCALAIGGRWQGTGFAVVAGRKSR